MATTAMMGTLMRQPTRAPARSMARLSIRSRILYWTDSTVIMLTPPTVTMPEGARGGRPVRFCISRRRSSWGMLKWMSRPMLSISVR